MNEQLKRELGESFIYKLLEDTPTVTDGRKERKREEKLERERNKEKE